MSCHDHDAYFPLQKWEEAFRDLLDEIFFPGYSQRLFEEKPEAYQREYYYFIRIFDEPTQD